MEIEVKESIDVNTRSAWINPSFFTNDTPTYYFGTTVDLKGNSVSGTSLPMDIVLVVDVSGSMGPAMTQVHQMVNCVAQTLSTQDRIGIVSFEHVAQILLPLRHIESENDPAFQSAVNKLIANGSTNISDGLEKGVEVLKEGKSSNRRIGLIMLLSDGEANAGIRDPDILLTSLQNQILAYLPDQFVIIHSFGFTDNHDTIMLSKVTSAGNFDTGMYYFIQDKLDITSAVGDCLGSFSLSSGYDITLSATFSPQENSTLVWKCCILRDGANIKQSDKVNLGIISPNQKQTFIVICYSDSIPSNSLLEETEQFIPNISNSDYPILNLSLSYSELSGNRRTITRTISSLENQESNLTYLHVISHVMRVKVAYALYRTLDPGARSIIPDLEQLHEQLLVVMGQIQEVESDIMMEDEGLLVTLERDLGAAIERLQESSSGRFSSVLYARFLQFAHEHQYQRSASTGTHVRNTYSTTEQSYMRSRFLNSGEDVTVKTLEEKSKLLIEEQGLILSEEEIVKREEMEKEVCFVSFETWRETTLGIGLLVRPRTTRERRKKLMPVIELVHDYISADSYNSGVRVNFSNPTANLDRENQENEESHLAVKSSTRGRINGWLPLYINSTNWKYSKSWAASAFSIIATQFNDMFKPIHALKVCAKLMIQSVVKFTIHEGHISSRAIQMYCDVHRLFMAMTEEHPAIISEAEDALEKFINEPLSRNRKYTPDLGDLIQYLTITNKFTWEDIKIPYIIEAIRRITLHVDHTILTEINGGIDGVLEFWSENTTSTRVTMFSVLFMKVVKTPGKSLKEIAEIYDRRWGRISEEVLQEIKNGFTKVMNVTSIKDVFEYFGINCSRSAIAELILWGFENTYDTDPGLKYLPNGMPKSAGPCVQLWRERTKILENSRKNPPPEIKHLPPIRQKRKWLSGVSKTVSLLQSNSETWETEPTPVQPPNKKARFIERWNNWKPTVSTTDPSCVLFVGRLSRHVTEDHIIEALSPYVKPLDVRVIRNHKGKSNKYAFALLPSTEDLEQLLNKCYWKEEGDGESNPQSGSFLWIVDRWALLDREQGRTNKLFMEWMRSKFLNLTKMDI